jgi:hypothetical protein
MGMVASHGHSNSLKDGSISLAAKGGSPILVIEDEGCVYARGTYSRTHSLLVYFPLNSEDLIGFGRNIVSLLRACNYG